MSARVSVYEKQIAEEIEQMPKEYWKEAMNGETYPIADLWAGIDAE